MDDGLGEYGEVLYCSPPLGPGGHPREPRTQSHPRPGAKVSISMAKADNRAVPSGKVYRQLFDAQVQLSRSLLAGWKDLSVQSNTHCSTASSKKEDIDTEDSDDVSGLPDTLAASGSGSDVIERLTKKKITKHQETLEQLDTELSVISKVFESNVRAASEALLSSLHEVDLRLDKLSHRMELTEELKLYSLQDMCSLWEEVEEEVKLRRSRIIELYSTLSQYETQRTAQIQAVLKSHCGLLEKISFLPLSDIHRLLHTKATMLNQSLLANRRSVCRLLLHLLVENLQGASVLHQRWEDCVEQWRNNSVQEIVKHYSELCSSDLDEELFSEQPEIQNIHQTLRKESVRRCEVVSSLCSLAPPTCTSVLVSDWFDQLKTVNHQIDGLHGDLLRCIRSCYDQTWQDRLVEVQNCEDALRALQLPQTQATNIVTSRLLPLIGQSQNKADKRLAALDVSSDSVARHSFSLSGSVFRVMHRAVLLWEEHCSNLKNTEEEVQRRVDELRHLQEEQLQSKRLHLDEQLSVLRQESSEKALSASLDKALLELQELHDSCRQNLSDQNAVLDRLPALYLLELQNYSSRLSAFFHLSSIYTLSPEELDPAFSGLDLSLKATINQTKEKDEMNSDAAQTQADSGLLDLCHINSTEEFTSSRGQTYSGPAFVCRAPELDESLKDRQLVVFPVELLSQTLSRVRSMFVEQLEQHFHHGLLSALSLLSQLKQEALSEQDVQLQQLSAQHIHQHVFQPRLAELQLHLQQVDLHCERVSHLLTSLSKGLKELLESVSKRNQTFSSTVSSMESSLGTIDSLQRLETLSSILKECLENHLADTRGSQTSFRKSVQVQLEQLKEATARLLRSFRLFSEGGDCNPHEMKVFHKRLKSEMKRISVEEESILGQLEAFNSDSLQQVKEVYGLQEKLSFLKSEFMFVEKAQNILRSTQIRIKAEAASSNQQQTDISSKIQELRGLLDEREVCPAQVCSLLSALCQTLHQRAQYLHFTLVSEQRPLQEDSPLSAPSAPPSSALQPYGSGGGLHDDPLLGLIRSLNREQTRDDSPERDLRGRAVSLGQSSGPLQKRGECPASLRRGGRTLRVDWRLQAFGPRPEQDTLSFSSTISALLWKASDAVMLVAEDFYQSNPCVSRFLLVPDSLEQWVDNMQQRLLGYHEQACSFLSTSKNEFVRHLSLLETLRLVLAEVLMRKHEQQHQKNLRTEMDRIRQELDHSMAQSEKEKCGIVGQLRLCISGEALQTLRLREQQRQQELNSAIHCSVRAQEECLQLAGQDFVTSLASLTEKLLALLDLLITADEVKAASQLSENTEGTAHRPHSGKRVWQGIPHFPLSSVTTAAASVTTNKCTPGHEAVIQERDAAVQRFGEMYRGELRRLDSDKQKRLREVENWSVHWSQQLTLN